MGPNSFNWTSFLGTLDQRDNNISTVVLDWRLIDGSAEQHRFFYLTGVDEQGQSMRIAWKVWSLTGNLFTEKLGGYGEIINTIYTNKLQHVTIENIETNKQKGVSDTQWAVL